MINFSSAVGDFRRARQRAALKDIISRFTGNSSSLLSYDEVRQRLRAQTGSDRGLQEIPLDAIIGSVNRYTDFTRDFLPRASIQPDRWARVEVAADQMEGLPPIEVYQIGSVYFVKDGNHRVSVARQIGSKTIEAYVTEVKSRVPLTPDTSPEDLILKEEYAVFLEKIPIKDVRPEADLTLTAPGKYSILEEHIAVHRYYMGLEQMREIPLMEAAAHWYDTVYLPVARIIRDNGILRDFPKRTEADLYLWIADRRALLEQDLQREIRPADAARDLALQRSTRPARVAARLGGRIKGAIVPEPLESGPPAGEWRRNKSSAHESSFETLFADILIPISGEDDSWEAVRQGIIIARKESARLHGLHVVPPGENRENERTLFIQAEFERMCREAGVDGSLQLETGDIVPNICGQSRWNDLIVMNLQYPPTPQPLASFAHGFRQAIQRCPRPVLAVPEGASEVNRALLAYDGSPKADEALYVSTYIAGMLKCSLVVLSVQDINGKAEERLETAKAYLKEHGIKAAYLTSEGPVAETILSTGRKKNCDLLLMGGYGKSALLNVVFGSVVDQVLRESTIPLLICR